MRNEVKAAAEWLTRTIESDDLTPDQLQRFEWALVEALTRKYTDHWYREMPWRGQGYRSILSESADDCAAVVDHVLRDAAREANIADLPMRMSSEAFVIWVDPGDVEVKFLKSHRTELLYHEPALHMHHNPYLPHSEALSSSPPRSSATTPSGPATSSSRAAGMGEGHRARSLADESLLFSDDEPSMRYSTSHSSHQQQHILNASDSAINVRPSVHHQHQRYPQRGHTTSPPPRAGSPPQQQSASGLWNSASGINSYKIAKRPLNYQARPWERPAAPAWAASATKGALRSTSGLAVGQVM